MVTPVNHAQPSDLSEQRLDSGRRLASAMFTLGKHQASFGARLSRAGVDRSAMVVLKTLHALGPCRSSALAGAMHSDPSTVSRQVAAAVKDGLVERTADPDDGRATLLVATDKGLALLAAQRERIATSMATMLADWDLSEVDTFVDLFERFLGEHERHLPTLINECVWQARSGGEN